jgi:serine protease Do
MRGGWIAAALGLWLAAGCAGEPAPEAERMLTNEASGEDTDALPAEEQEIIEVTEEVSPAVVSILTRGGSGSGVIVREDGVVLTNAHVVGDAREVLVGLATGTQVRGRVLGTARSVDIAVVDIPGANLPVAPLADSDELRVGQTAIAIGNPLGYERTVTTGIVSAINRTLEAGYEELIQTDAAINPGNSGGPLLDSSGRVIGINTAVINQLPRGGAVVGLGFAVPINLARYIADQLLTTGRVRRAYLGVGYREVEPELSARFGLPVSEGIIVLRVEPGSPAAAGGMRPGHIITRVDEVEIKNGGDLRRVLRAHQAGDVIAIQVVLPEGRATVRVRLQQIEE